MTAKELTEVREFTVYNTHGSIKFIESTDVSYLDLDALITISYLSAEVNIDHAMGQQLNCLAEITLTGVESENEATTAEILKAQCEDQGQMFVSYIGGRLTFKVSKW
jgi:hypothetical protein